MRRKTAEVNPKPPFRSRSINWDADLLPDSRDRRRCPTLNPRDVMQLAFVLEENGELPTTQVEADKPGVIHKPLAGREEKSIALGQLSIRWRGPMGEKGSLKTGWLTAQRA